MRYWMHGDGTEGIMVTDDKNLYGLPVGVREVIPVVVGSRAWAAVMILDGKKVWNVELQDRAGETHASMFTLQHDSQASKLDKGWYLLPPSPPLLRRGDRVKGWDAMGVEWVGPYWGVSHAKNQSHYLGATGPTLWVSRVEREATP